VIAPETPRDHVTPYDRFAWSDAQIEEWLATGAHRAELSGYFGTVGYRQLAALARRVQRRPPAADALRVLIVPGIMGSQLGLRRPTPLPDDILWLDPIDIQQGRLAALRVGAAAGIVPLGAVLYSYLPLKLFLRSRGFFAELFDYDWRLSVAELGATLAARLRTMRAAPVAVVAHSMGGLVARAALAHSGTAHVERLVLLGTPNCGSFAAVQALRGTYAVVRRVAQLALRASAEELAAAVFNTFPSLYDLLPTGACDRRERLFEATAWPRSGPQPHPGLLEKARLSQRLLLPADARVAAIVGVGIDTVTAVRRRGDDFVYTLTRHGDGTVPAVSGVLAGATCAYARVAHSDLTRDPLIAASVADLLHHGATRRLPRSWHARGAARAEVSDRQLRALNTNKVDWAALSPEARRLFLENLNEPPRFRLAVPKKRRRRNSSAGRQSRAFGARYRS
jgi:pimeloyl-ACP methyl ester carboxylesterase